VSDDDLPEWAAEWLPGRCGCGARLVRPDCYCGDHIACVESGWDIRRCPRAASPTPDQP
jgi:hypothetical protein